MTVSLAFSTTQRTALPVFQQTVAGLKNLWVQGSLGEASVRGGRSQARVGGALGSYRGGKLCPLVSLMTKFC
jgi:hypothetical protein